jgi:uncharacterized protein
MKLRNTLVKKTSAKTMPIKMLSLSLGLAVMLAFGVAAEASRPERGNEITRSNSFLAGHPDLHWRTLGSKNYSGGRFEDALKQFKRAARHADKVSQAMVAEMFWNGEGTEADRALAYAWMDLAAERGYKDLLAKREAYWNQLTPEEREQALTKGEAVYAEYGDAVAKPRIAAALRRARNNITGSRTGAVGTLRIQISDGVGGALEVNGSDYFASKYWEPREYFEWQEKIWNDRPRGQVDVGAVAPEGRASASE